MAGKLALVKAEWHRFKNDPPGERFENHRERIKDRSRWHSAIALAAGILLIVSGVVFCFIPGPGLPQIVFGLGLVASHSRPLSNVLDRAEPVLRGFGAAVQRWWRNLPVVGKASVILGSVALAAAMTLGIWRFVDLYLV